MLLIETDSRKRKAKQLNRLSLMQLLRNWQPSRLIEGQITFASLVVKSGQGETISPTQVPLHVIQELLDAVQLDADLDYSSSEEDSEANGGRVVMAVKSADNFGTAHSDRKNRTLRFRGFIDSKEVLILLDSGSARTFISQEVASLISQP